MFTVATPAEIYPLQVIDLSKEQERTKQQESRSKQAEFEAAAKRAAVVRGCMPGPNISHGASTLASAMPLTLCGRLAWGMALSEPANC